MTQPPMIFEELSFIRYFGCAFLFGIDKSLGGIVDFISGAMTMLLIHHTEANISIYTTSMAEMSMELMAGTQVLGFGSGVACVEEDVEN